MSARSLPRAPRYSRSHGVLPLPDALSLALLLTILAPAGIEFGRLSFWDHFQQPWPAFLCGALCCGLASLNRKPGWWLLWAVVLGVIAVYLTVFRVQPGSDFLLRDEQTRLRFLTWFRQVLDGYRVEDDLAVNAWTTAAAWFAGMWAAWAALRVGLHWLVLVATGSVLLSSIAYQKGWPAGSLLLFIFATLLFLARLHHRRRLAQAAADGAPVLKAGAGAWAPHLATVAAVSGLLLAIGWLLPELHLRSPALITTPGPRLELPGSLARGRAQTVLHDFGSVLSFSGPVDLGDAPAATVESRTPGYLFGVAYDSYEGSGWSSSASDQPRSRAAGPTSFEPAGWGAMYHAPTGQLRLERGSSGSDGYADSERVEVTVSPAVSGSVLLAAGPPLAVTAARLQVDLVAPRRFASRGLQYSPQSLKGAPTGEYTALIATAPLPMGISYTTSGLVSHATAEALASDQDTADAWVHGAYTQLPPKLPQRVRDLAFRLTANAHNDYDRARAVQTYLRQLTYDASISAPAPGQDGVDYLLFVTGRGYCDYFASAMAVLLRSVNVPARVVVGYVMHETSASGGFVVRERDAHAWTEVFFPGYGWQRFDPTPGGAAVYAQSAALPLAPVNPAAPAPAAVPVEPVIPPGSLAPAPATGDISANPDVVRRGTDQSVSMPLLWTALLALVAIFLSYAFYRRMRETRYAVVTAWLGTTTAGRLLGRGQTPHETPVEYAAALKRRHQGAAGAEALAAAYSQARYGPPEAGVNRPPRLWRRTAATAFALLRGRLGRGRPPS